jgi:hypothetical protein
MVGSPVVPHFLRMMAETAGWTSVLEVRTESCPANLTFLAELSVILTGIVHSRRGGKDLLLFPKCVAVICFAREVNCDAVGLFCCTLCVVARTMFGA